MAGTNDRIRALIQEAMQDAWNTICSDTGHHPNDIKHGRGKYLEFKPGHWADQIALHVARRVANDVAYADLRASGGIFPVATDREPITDGMVKAALDALNGARVGSRGPVPKQAMEKAIAAALRERG